MPNQFAVTEVILEFGRRPGTANALSLIYTDQSYNLPRELTRLLPTTDLFDASFTFNIAATDANPMRVGELFDYQFRVTHRTADGSPLYTWSERKTLQVAPRFPRPNPSDPNPPDPNPPPPPGADCAFRLANVSLPVTVIGGGSTQALATGAPTISADGRFVAFVSRTKYDPNAADVDQIYRRDLQDSTIAVVSRPARTISGGSVEDKGGSAPSISADGQRVAFVSETKFDPNAADGPQVYVRDLSDSRIIRVSTPARAIGGGATADLGGRAPAISADGRFVAFVSRTKYDPNAADVDQIYRRDLQDSTIAVVSRPARTISGGSVEDKGGSAQSISRDGQFVVFVSETKFDPNAANGSQVYVRDLGTGNILQVTTPAQGIGSGTTADLGGNAPAISGAGRLVVFVSRTKFDANAPANFDSVYLRCVSPP